MEVDDPAIQSAQDETAAGLVSRLHGFL